MLKCMMFQSFGWYTELNDPILRNMQAKMAANPKYEWPLWTHSESVS